ncbi:hypothetical protein A2893_02650 [Candidatus Woesebacteria bacterium RIFCSPLOWO2_01_FULL_39_25]|uniref:DNA primase/polymerase bifunctional N-terminal domain-containing protein n=1 Tax=Candidatus Woesebacteria bacterium RIFCSPLOWO2_01_FULL_39_25 TaxID=1802521 RepID=A0A1F8BIV3_9BACT|nr:MAG: hypothetical protein A2893_02650 [Candidatus Woesebacteria bacterium RIFCSPLOWO2_01_FULL_39_25]
MGKAINNQDDFNKWIEISKTYIGLNWSLVPTGSDKNPLISWSEFQQRRANVNEVSAWFNNPNFGGLAVVTGKISGISVWDIDKGADINNIQLPVTPTVKTGNEGLHLYFKCQDGLSCITAFRNKMDFKAEGGLIMLPPSLHPNGNRYEWVDGKDYLAPLADIPQWLLDELKKKTSSEKFDYRLLKGVEEGRRNTSAAKVVGLFLSHFPEEEWLSIVLPAFQGWNLQNKPPIPDKELLNTYYSISKSEKEDRKDQKQGRKQKIIEVYDIAPMGVIDILEDNGALTYFTKNGSQEQFDDLVNIGQVLIPPPIDKCPYSFPNKNKVLELIRNWKPEDDQSLYQDLVDYHKAISELPDEDYYHLLALWDIHTWLIEKCHNSPILYFYAVKERGKSRTVKGLVYVAMRGIFTETIREADIIRWANDHKATLGFDVKDAANKIKYSNCDDLFLSRFEKGGIASRTLFPEKGAFADTKVFKLFGPTIIASNRPVDDILESRSISIDMKPTNRKFNEPVLPEDALELKNRLSAFRYVHFEDQLIKTDKPADGRLGDIIFPLFQILLTYFPNQKPIFLRLLNKIVKRKFEDATDSFEAKIIESVVELKNQVSGGKLPIELITNYHNEVNKMTIKNQTIGRLLSALGFEKMRIANGKRAILYDDGLINKLSQQYGINEQSDNNDTINKDIEGIQRQLLNL